MFEVRNITKSYYTPRGRRYVFRDISFSIPPDRNIGLIGKNGSGKSTLMRLLGGADTPDRGKIVTNKSVSWPVGLTGGFQGSMSGKDNVKFVCRVYGAVGPRMSEVLQYVRDFSDLGKWFDEPVRSYSSGMRSRLAFGLSMAFDFDYYLIDEVMSVGDSHFKKKSNQVFAKKMKTSNIILVSHSMEDIRRLCNLVLLVENGTITMFDDVESGIAAYQA
ncbi:ABC transporter ATP-binding protein [Achromobacter sp. Bel]|uniref:ABC transporter ATP-binding protein n=1 Tax=Achromobacter sp. Bel TaxID=2727415 RepID=UPI00145D36AA|nr:ABC transporter ATP-binding protein [Achromobacter sp. Bel]NMK45021.1 ABC transporter ATP-binding protein [Achromobacter sp. Bel]